MKFKNAIILGDDFTFRKGGFTVENGIFASFEETESGIDLEGRYVIPGLIDIHFHGNSGEDFSVTDFDGLTKIAASLARRGITSFAPASMTMPEAVLEKAYRNAAEFHAKQPAGISRLAGINMEGPYFSKEKKGAQAEEYLMLPDVHMVERLDKASGGLLKIVCIAPELPGALDFIEKISSRFTVSLAHTNADYEIAKMAINAGARQLTHLFNAMPPLLHRQPGVIGAGAEAHQVMAELICDGAHVHESAVRAAFAMFSADRIILISDALSCLGMPEGIYESGGQKILMKNGAAVLSDGVTFAGSTTDLYKCMQKAISFGIRAEDAIKAASANPAKAIREEDRVGSIAVGKQADFVVCDKNFNLQECYIDGLPV
ncbi:N-acetylglucosamine-6-phosphate deacetylase [Anoxybacterium hadale]|uniref:N-acetylglucosamine-6-phosphate deacetylase n=1 Tax=Anoxybacterium hadale TaxID=3408580 RepID=A0ACD1AEC6_9FIRM|nr:N-acetylglucosamine-6-phosphate deacetylase [Clostridiales bacterium]